MAFEGMIHVTLDVSCGKMNLYDVSFNVYICAYVQYICVYSNIYIYTYICAFFANTDVHLSV